METSAEERVNLATALYSKSVLFLYDWMMLGYNCHFLWKCPSRHLLDIYNRFVTTNHLDVGVGTGYFMHKCRFPAPKPRLALMDYSPNSLNAAARRLSRYRPEVYLRNVLQPFDLPAPEFDSIALMNLLHCLPGNMKTKGVVFEHAVEVMNPGGVLFGSTILYRKDRNDVMTTMALDMSNRRGYMTNRDDIVEDLEESLAAHFPESSVRLIGYEALFWARKQAQPGTSK